MYKDEIDELIEEWKICLKRLCFVLGWGLIHIYIGIRDYWLERSVSDDFVMSIKLRVPNFISF